MIFGKIKYLMEKFNLIIIGLLIILFGCNQDNINKKKQETVKSKTDTLVHKNSDSISINEPTQEPADTLLTDIESFSDNFIFEIVYACENNFFQKKFYNCPKCYLRYEAIKALIKSSNDFRKIGYKIKLFDCFRPFKVQEEMWKTLPDRRYVANPQTGGSIHNKGAAVDLTLTDLSGKNLDMGTEFDYFGPESAHSYSNIDTICIYNRRILKEIMEKNGFKSLESEWWHYTYISKNKYKNANKIFECN
ncbi:MAG: M15 family metallopeptidase [Bacteroidales bacterium]|nr:M15 family metallopeptidase [Bacteroidales bacterium]